MGENVKNVKTNRGENRYEWKMVKPVANGKTLKRAAPNNDTSSKMVKPPSALKWHNW